MIAPARPRTTKVTVNMPTRDFEKVEKVASRRDITRTDALLRLLRTGEAIEDFLRNGAKIIVKEKDGTESVLRLA